MSAPSAPLALSVRGLVKRYADVTAVDGLDLEVRAGECFGLLGPNGAGKTTTIEICEGLTAADAGEVTVLGRRWDRHPRELRERLGICLQDTQLSDKLTVEETLTLFASFYDVARPVDDVIAMVSLGEKRASRVVGLSGGQKQRLAVACAMVGEPELLFLDEPTTGLDPQSRRQLWELVERFKSTGRTVVLTTHYMEEAEVLCDRVAIVDHGKVIALGTPRELVASLDAEHVVDFTLAHDAEVALDLLQALPGVRSARRTAGLYELAVGAVHEALPGLLALLAARGVELAELKTHSPTLEDVFVGLTGRALRDE
ncbi:MAG: ABC transporter ATP-binding protein [Gemmatimonadetes bacterium]|nr:ABC transporter ATP-binding protein [Gemmatimonadota bacterium]